MIETRDHGASIGAELGAERVWIGLKWENVAAGTHNLIFVDGAFIELRDKNFPDAGGATCAHGMDASIPCAHVAPPASGKFLSRSSMKAPSTNMRLWVPAATFSHLRPIHTRSAPSSAPILAPWSRVSIITNGTTPIGSRTARRKTGSNHQSPSTKSISVPGGVSRKTTTAG